MAIFLNLYSFALLSIGLLIVAGIVLTNDAKGKEVSRQIPQRVRALLK